MDGSFVRLAQGFRNLVGSRFGQLDGLERLGELTEQVCFGDVDLSMSCTAVGKLGVGTVVVVVDFRFAGRFQSLGQMTAGSYDTFGESFTLGLELGYRAWLKRPDIKFQSGTFLTKHQSDLEKHVENSISAGLAFGWFF